MTRPIGELVRALAELSHPRPDRSFTVHVEDETLQLLDSLANALGVSRVRMASLLLRAAVVEASDDLDMLRSN